MVFSGSEAHPSGARKPVQPGIPDRAGGRPGILTSAGPFVAGLLATGLLAGCSSSSSLNPVNWWHGLQGGRIAEERPPPPNADAPYPNLSTVPPRPAPPDRDAMKRLTESLVGDRTHAQYLAESAPLPDPSSPRASPNLFGAGTLPPPAAAPPPRAPAAPPPDAGGSSVTLPSASAPPPPPTAPTPAPLRPVQSQPLEPPAAPEAPAAVQAEPAPAASPLAASLAATQPVTAPPQVAEASLPAVPAEPPPRSAITPPAPPPPAQPMAPAPVGAGGVMIGFAAGSSQLSPTAAQEVKAFAATRGAQPIAVTGYGDATSADPGAQTAAVSLALTRAQAVVNALTAAGVPRAAISLGAEAAGRGASLRLLQ